MSTPNKVIRPRDDVKMVDAQGFITTPWARWFQYLDDQMAQVNAYIVAHP